MNPFLTFSTFASHVDNLAWACNGMSKDACVDPSSVYSGPKDVLDGGHVGGIE